MEYLRTQIPPTSTNVNTLQSILPMRSHFTGSIEKTFTCTRCGIKKNKTDVFSTIFLPFIINDTNQTLNDLIANYFKDEEIVNNCDNLSCNGERATESKRLKELPTILILHLMRFAKIDGVFETQKLNNPVEFFPQLQLKNHLDTNLSLCAEDVANNSDIEICTAQMSSNYKLCAIVRHIGDSVDDGHYICG